MNQRISLILVTLVVFASVAVAQEVAPTIALDTPFQVRYAANLNVADSLINMTNTGATNKNICVNVYAFSPDEQLVSCCSCVITPNGLASLSAQRDLISNTLTPAVPTSIVVKLLATNNAGTCNAANPGALVDGLAAWGTTVHPRAGATPAYGITESAFTPATLSDGELKRISRTCGFIQSNGSGFGICRSCRLGGLGADIM